MNCRTWAGRAGQLLVSGFLLFVVSGLSARETDPLLTKLSPEDARLTAEGNEFLTDVRNALWAGLSTGSLEVGLDRSEKLFDRVRDPAARFYLLGQVALCRGRIKLAEGDKGDARDFFDRAMALAADSTDSQESSEAAALRADAGASWMLTKGLVGIIRMAPRVGEWSDRALALNEGNPLALMLSAQGQTNAPASAGGNPEEAVRRLEGLVARTDLDNILRFRSLMSLSMAYEKAGNAESARDSCARARAIFPDSPFLEDCSA